MITNSIGSTRMAPRRGGFVTAATVTQGNMWDAFQADDPSWLLCIANELVDEIMQHLPVWVLRILRHSSTYGRRAIFHLNDRVSYFLRHWNLPVDGTLAMMRRTNAILAGSAALWIVEPSAWFPATLDFFCPDHQYSAVCRWFKDQGYSMTSEATAPTPTTLTGDDLQFDPPAPNPIPYLRGNISDAVRCAGTFKHTQSGMKIQLLQSWSQHPAAPICFLESTLLMNFITGDGAVCLYPRLTRKKTGIINFVEDSPHFRVPQRKMLMLQKYTTRGYTFIRSDAIARQEERSFVPSERFLDDRHTIGMNFDDDHPMAVQPTLKWTTRVKVFEPSGFYDLEPTATVTLEGDEFVMMNHLEFKRLAMAPESL